MKPQYLRKRMLFVLPFLALLIFSTIIGIRLINRYNVKASTALVSLPGNIPVLVRNSTLTGETSSDQPLSLSIGLQIRNISSLQNYVDSMSKDQSINSHRYLNSAELQGAYAPLISSQKAIIDYLQSYNFKVTKTVKQNLIIDVNGTVGDAENAFHLTINNYRSPTGKDFYAPASDPVVPAYLSGLISSVIGMDNLSQIMPTTSTLSQSITAKVVPLDNSNCGAGQTFYPTYTPTQIATAYGLDGFYSAGFYGEGQRIALAEFDDYVSSDINNYTKCYGGASVPINKILVDGGTGGPPSYQAFQVEKAMELVLSTASHLAGLDVYEAPETAQGSIDMWAQIIGNDTASVISTNWGQCEKVMPTTQINEENALFLVAAAQGQSILAASGDFGTDDCRPNITDANFEAVDDPASQPYVTGIGGTSLTLNSDNTYNSEKVWNDGRGGDASGGGISTVWGMPSWQKGPGVNNTYSSGSPCNATTGYCREVPDVSLDADPTMGYLIYCSIAISCEPPVPGGPQPVWWYGGQTSGAAAIWAGFVALSNQKMLHDGGFSLGFINPYLYQIAQNSSMYSKDFHDVTEGDNDGLNFIGSTGIYPAGIGYDLASGLGSFNAWNLAGDLEMLANAANGTRSAPANKKWYFAEGSVGGQFTQYLTLLNPDASQSAHVSVQYLFENQNAITKTYTIASSTRFTTNVNDDLGIPSSATQQAISTIVTSDVAIVAERPLYFNRPADLSSSGTDVLGATNATNTTFYFASGDTNETNNDYAREFITILNPNTTSANITARYYSQGKIVDTETVSVSSLHRGTIQTPYQGQAAIEVTSDIGVVIERPIYYRNINVPAAGGKVSGAASTVAATASSNDWLFAEGHTADNFQENLVLANFGTDPTTATINLEYTNGSVQSIQVPVAAKSQLTFDVNNAYLHPDKSFNGTTTPDVSIEVISASPVVAERIMYFHYQGTISGVTDVVGEAGPSSHSVYSLAEGYTANSFQEWLTLQNPNANAETAAITLFFDGTVVEKEVVLPAHSRTTLNINDIVVPIAKVYADPNGGDGYNVSINVQSFGGSIVVERPLYFNFLSQSPGGTDVIGYTNS